MIFIASPPPQTQPFFLSARWVEVGSAAEQTPHARGAVNRRRGPPTIN